MKYQAALTKAGAVCEVVNLAAEPSTPESVAQPEPVESKIEVKERPEHVPDAPQTVPLDITGDQIADLSASLAPVGSDVQDAKDEVPELQVDLAGMDMAPAGSDLGNHEEKLVPPPPDTSGLSLKE